eukprot:TRINITY_DN14563_c0_g1_i1.p1 TRINITY_DN14563_c0_g1~~TRINITY_DN14563_c0_g1_i1.p1  ORF type:complete len:115 (-),score=6.83 TRINITY_DN14563_c0_g1_i1:93-437(-)
MTKSKSSHIPLSKSVGYIKHHLENVAGVCFKRVIMSESKQILLVEDDLTLGDWVREYLTEQGFIVKHCTRGDEVIACLKDFQADLVLLDVMLPGLNGIEVCRQIRQKCKPPLLC